MIQRAPQMATLTTNAALSMKLFIDTKSQRVVFAEAGKDVVDFLFSLLHLPLASVVSLVWGVSGSAGRLYHSADGEARLRGSGYGRPLPAMDPSLSSPSASAASLFFMPASSFEPSRIFFRCKNNHYRFYRNKHCYLYMTDVEGTRCPNCCDPMTAKLRHVSFLHPAPARSAHSDPTFSSSLAAPSRSEPSRIYFRCERQCNSGRFPGGCNMYMADVKSTACPNCDHPMTEPLYYVSPAFPNRSGGGASVQHQETATYTVRDDLSFTHKDPAISNVTLLSRSGITDLSAVEERTEPITYRKGVEILSALLHSRTVLTDVFIYKVRA